MFFSRPISVIFIALKQSLISWPQATLNKLKCTGNSCANNGKVETELKGRPILLLENREVKVGLW